jgi:anaerobic ribonucleoside-triphosphate reductase activating protein
MTYFADIRRFDTANGNGISSSIFFSGCNFHCKGCFNQEAQQFNYGQLYTQETEDLFISYLKNEHVSHASLLGGETFQQDLNKIYKLVKRIKKEVNKPIWIWTGYLWESLIQDEHKLEILKYIDILVDGQFEIDKKDYNLLWKGSSNQRTINVQESFKQNKLILYEGGVA